MKCSGCETECAPLPPMYVLSTRKGMVDTTRVFHDSVCLAKWMQEFLDASLESECLRDHFEDVEEETLIEAVADLGDGAVRLAAEQIGLDLCPLTHPHCSNRRVSV